MTKVIASAVAEGLQARSGAKTEAEGAEPLAEWEQELLTSGTGSDGASLPDAGVEATVDTAAAAPAGASSNGTQQTAG